MTEFKTQVNMRGGPDLNMSFSFTRFPETSEEAEAAGYQDARLIARYMEGYSRAVEDMNTEASA